ncbi:MAG: PhoH family protein, partial [Bacteroidaceae bacterium]|nr:PhoH family protein [Bacteroidaceae bacterium]
DLPSSVRSGLSHAMHLLRGIKGIGIVELNKKDIVRHKLVTRIVEAYEKEASPSPSRRGVTDAESSETLN